MYSSLSTSRCLVPSLTLIPTVVSASSSYFARSFTSTLLTSSSKFPLPRSTSLSSTSFPSSSPIFSSFPRHFAIDVVKVPSLGDSISEGTLIKWAKKEGEYVAKDEVVCQIETDKVSVDIRSSSAGTIKSIKAKEGQTIKVGEELAHVDADGKPPAGSPAPAAPAKAAAAPSAPSSAPSHSPSSSPSPSSAPATSPAKSSSPPPPPSSPPPAPGTRSIRRVPMTRMRQTIANRLKFAQNTAASLTTFNEIDMTNLMELRNKYKDEFVEKHGIKFGFMSAFVKASTAALIKIPDVNASIEGTDIVYHDFVDVSVAVSTPTGLVVPVLRNTEGMTFHQVEAAIYALGQKARKNQIAMEDMVGGTFTISNGGVYGSLFGTPILNPPQSAILGMHGIFKRPIVVGDKVEIRPMMYVALTYDHRIIDGGTAVTFLKEIKSNVEDPSRLLLSL